MSFGQAEETVFLSVRDSMKRNDLSKLMERDISVLLWELWMQRCPSAQSWSSRTSFGVVHFLDDRRRLFFEAINLA